MVAPVYTVQIFTNQLLPLLFLNIIFQLYLLQNSGNIIYTVSAELHIESSWTKVNQHLFLNGNDHLKSQIQEGIEYLHDIEFS